MKRLSGFLVVVLLLAVSACSGGDDPKPKPGEKTTKAASGVTFESLGGKDWPAGDSVLSLDDLPKAPAGFTDADVKLLANHLIKWGKVTSLDKKAYTAKNPVELIKPTLPLATFRTLAASIGTAGPTPRMNAVNAFANDVEILSEPRQTSSWGVDVKANNGPPLLHVVLQTRTAYEVKTEDADPRVIGVVREHGLYLGEGASVPEEKAFGWYWVEYAVDDCEMAEKDGLYPMADKVKGAKELKEFQSYFDEKTYRKVRQSKENQTDEKLLRRCRDEGAA